jgi:phage gp29-like protein
MVWSRIYNSTLFGIGGTIILVSFFAIVWIWIKKYAALDIQEKIAGSFKLIGYIFWINASWFMCGEAARIHLKAFEGKSPPIPIEVMVFLVLGWLFVLVGDYKSMRLNSNLQHH